MCNTIHSHRLTYVQPTPTPCQNCGNCRSRHHHEPRPTVTHQNVCNVCQTVVQTINGNTVTTTTCPGTNGSSGTIDTTTT